MVESGSRFKHGQEQPDFKNLSLKLIKAEEMLLH